MGTPFINPSVFQNAVSPPHRNPHAIVLIGGVRYDTFKDKQLVKQVVVELDTDKASEGRITLFDPRATHLNKFSDSSGAKFVPLLFYMGFGTDLGEPIFKGLLTRVERSSSDTTFTAYDMGYRMRQEKKAEYHKGDDIAIIKKLAERNGLKFSPPEKVDPPLDSHQSLIHDFKYDWDFALERADDAGFNMFVRQDTLFLREPATLSKPDLILRYRKDFWLLHDFSLTYKLPENEAGRPKIVEVRGRARGGKRLTGKSNQHSRGHIPVEGSRDLVMHTKKWANRRAHAIKAKSREPSWDLDIVSIPPLPHVRPDIRNTIRLEGRELGNLFMGDYLCDKVTHTLTGSGFHTEYRLYRDVDD